MNQQWGPKELLISYSQLLVYNKGSNIPFMNWTDEDVKKGYVQQENGIAFATLSDYKAEIYVHLTDQPIKGDLVLPFHVQESGIVVTSILAKKYEFPIPPGEYEIGFGAIPLEEPSESGLYRVRYDLSFRKKY